ncbi:MAG: PH domain-containing protein [Gemmatimonadota bacterium]
MRHYRSRVDFLTLILLVAAIFMVDTAAMGVAMQAVTSYYPYASFAAFLGTAGFAVALLLFVYPVRYSLGDGELQVRSGVLRWRILLEEIHAARPVHNLWPAPALSSRRLRLEYSRGSRVRTLYLSPQDEGAFLDDLASRDRGLQREGDEVVRRGGRILRLDSVG